MIVLLILISSAIQSISSVEFYVNPQQDESCESNCFDRSNANACCSIESIAEKYGKNMSTITVHFSGKVNINKLVLFKNISSLTFMGNLTSKPALNCGSTPLCKDCGLKFIGVEMLKIYNVDIIECGFKHFVGNGNIEINTAIAIFDCGKVLLDNVVIDRSNTTSLLVDSRAVALRNVTVQNNIKPLGEGIEGKFFAGGIQILISKNGTSVDIRNCLFDNISARSFNESLSRKLNEKIKIGLVLA